jgi:hypothetical protein
MSKNTTSTIRASRHNSTREFRIGSVSQGIDQLPTPIIEWLADQASNERPITDVLASAARFQYRIITALSDDTRSWLSKQATDTQTTIADMIVSIINDAYLDEMYPVEPDTPVCGAAVDGHDVDVTFDSEPFDTAVANAQTSLDEIVTHNKRGAPDTGGLLQCKCDVCLKDEPTFVVSSTLGPVSFSYCTECVKNNAEPVFTFKYLWDELGDGVADHVRQCKTFVDGSYITWDEIVAQQAQSNDT